jgi:hypothetical protein
MENPITEDSETVPETQVTTQESASALEGLVASPKQTVGVFYLILVSFLLLALIFTVFFEIKRQHPRHVTAGILLIILILVLAYVFREVLFGTVLVV